MSLPYYKKRYIVMAIESLLLLIVPFVKINDHHLFLLSFDHKRLELLGVAFDMQEFYLMPFLLMFAFLFVFAVTTIGGRVWCGWACPQTVFRVIYRDLIEGVLLGMRRRENKQKEVDYSLPINKIKKAVAIGLWIIIAFVAAADFSWYVVPPEDFFVYIQNPAEHKVLIGMIMIIALFLIYDVLKMGEKFCTYLCPYVRIQSSMYDRDTVYTIYDDKRGGAVFDEGIKVGKKPLSGDCTGCEACVKVCPTHIDIRKGLQLECLNCLECADACTVVMDKLGKPTLISWTSARAAIDGLKTRFVRFRSIAYAVLLTGIFAVLVVMSGTKETMLLNINKSGKIYQIDEQTKRVTNDYVFLFSNTSAEPHTYYFEVIGNDAIRISTPLEPFEIAADSKQKKVVILYSDQPLSDGSSNDTKLLVKIRAYAVDDATISVEREAIFAYPPKNLVEQ